MSSREGPEPSTSIAGSGAMLLSALGVHEPAAEAREEVPRDSGSDWHAVVEDAENALRDLLAGLDRFADELRELHADVVREGSYPVGLDDASFLAFRHFLDFVEVRASGLQPRIDELKGRVIALYAGTRGN